jgi:hypothetical protein
MIGAVADGDAVLALYKNGSPLHNGCRIVASASVVWGPSLSVTEFANGTDYFDLRVYQANPSSTTLTFTGDPVETYFTGHRVG